MVKKGFTLAEVLITLMIVGIVATLTTPALVKNVGSSKIGPQLSKFVNTWETATETMLMEENVGSLSSVNVSISSTVMEKLSKYMIMSSLKNLTSPSSINVTDASGKSLATISFSDGSAWQLKDGTIINANNLYGWYAEKGSYKGYYGSILVDIGGIKGSHRAGKEVFLFMIDESGVLVPYGSSAHKSLDSSMTATCDPSGTTFNTLFACTGAIADNAWKAPW